jgi:hypothetical protein
LSTTLTVIYHIKNKEYDMSYESKIIKDSVTGDFYCVDDTNKRSLEDLREAKARHAEWISNIEAVTTVEVPQPETPAEQPQEPTPAPEPVIVPAEQVTDQPAPQVVEVNGQDVPVNQDGNIVIDPTPETPAQPQVEQPLNPQPVITLN